MKAGVIQELRREEEEVPDLGRFFTNPLIFLLSGACMGSGGCSAPTCGWRRRRESSARFTFSLAYGMNFFSRKVHWEESLWARVSNGVGKPMP